MGNFKFKKKFGQNFMKDISVLNKIVDISEIDKNSLVIEVGPGDGRLSVLLAKKCKHLICYEIDLDLKNKLDSRFISFDNIEVIFDDFLSIDILSDVSKYCYDKIFFVSNVPYYITTAIITKLIDCGVIFNKIVLMVQNEVGLRLCSSYGSSSYNAFNVITSYYYNVNYEFFVSRLSFVPSPNVDSCVISLTPTFFNSLKSFDNFKKIVFDSFKFKRKNLKNNLKYYDLDVINRILYKYDLNLNMRAENVPLEVFIELSNSLFNNKK